MGSKSASAEFMYQLRYVVLDYRTEDNKILPKPKGRYIKGELSEERNRALRELVYILMDTDIITDASKIYLSTPYISYKGVAEEIAIDSGTKPNESTIQSRIWNDKNKLVDLFGYRIVLDIVEYRGVDISEYLLRISNVLDKTCRSDMLKYINLEFKCDNQFCNDVSDEEFNEFLEIIMPYTKRAMSKVQENVSEKVVNYVRYIQSHHMLSDKDEERYRELSELVK